MQAFIQVWEHIQAHIQVWEHIQALVCALFGPDLEVPLCTTSRHLDFKASLGVTQVQAQLTFGVGSGSGQP